MRGSASVGMAASLLAFALALPCAARATAPRRGRRRGQYKQVARDLVTMIVKGKAEDAARRARDYLEEHPDDFESMYVLAAADSSMGDVPRAMEYVRKAVEAGLPFDRFLAGPRDVFRDLTQSRDFKAYARERGVALVHGPVVGSVTDTSARFWVRTAGESRVRIRVSAADGGGAARIASTRTREADDFTAVAEVTGLDSATRYVYSISIGRRRVALDPAPSLRTFPRAGEPAKFDVAFGGGAGYTPWHEGMWDTVRKREPLALLLLGDNVYIDTPKVPETQRYCYYRRQSRPEYRRLVATTAVYAIWDDHDFGTNDCSSAPEIDKPAWKIPVWRVFKENWVNPAYGGGEARPGCWYDFAIGDVDFFMLDGRTYRTKTATPPTMLGPEQKRWLFPRLKASRATFKVLASPVPWAFGAKPGSKDPWQGFLEEREEIFSFLSQNRIEGVFLISADRHRSDAWKIERPDGYALYEFESSKLTNVHTHGIMKGSLFGYNAKCSFGLLSFDTTKPDPEVVYKIVSIDDEVIETFPLRKSELTH